MDELIEQLFTIPYVEGGRGPHGVDCWGLCVMCLEKFHKVKIKDFNGVHFIEGESEINKSVSQVVLTYKDELFDEVTTPKMGDVVVLNILGLPIHIGFMLSNKDMIHTTSQHGTVVENLRSHKWENRIVGYYRLKGE